jgi:hypothetical protein
MCGTFSFGPDIVRDGTVRHWSDTVSAFDGTEWTLDTEETT